MATITRNNAQQAAFSAGSNLIGRLTIPQRRLQLLAQFSLLQALAQFITALSGLLLVRALDKAEFAAYAIATSLLVALNVLSDCGLSTGLNSIGGRVWREPGAMRRLVSTAILFRARLAVIAAPFGVAFSLVLFRQNRISWTEALALTCAVILALWGTMNVNTYGLSLRLTGKYLEVQRLELITGLVRLAILLGMFLVFLNATLAIIATALSVSAQSVWLQHKARSVLGPGTPIDHAYLVALGRCVKSQWFSTVFFAFQGQITIWLIALFGTRDRIAEVGALGRLAVFFAFVTSLINGIATPALARCEAILRLRRLFALMLLGYLFFAATLLTSTIAFPREILWLLGSQYAGLQDMLPLAVGSSALWGLTGVFYALASARGWIWHAWTSPLLTVGLQVLLLRVLDLSQVRGVLVFALWSALPVLGSVAYMVARGLRTQASCRAELHQPGTQPAEV